MFRDRMAWIQRTCPSPSLRRGLRSDPLTTDWEKKEKRRRAAKKPAVVAWRANLSRSVKEIHFLFCQSSPASAPAREFVKNYGDVKARNPSLPFLVRECSGVEPHLWPCYDMGVERCVRLDALTEAQIEKKLEELAKAGGSLKA